MAPAVAYLPMGTQDSVHGGDRSQVEAFIQELGIDGGRGLVDVVVTVEDLAYRCAFRFAERPGLGSRHPLELGRGRALAVPAVVTGP